MDNMEQMLSSVMNDPETMSKIMAFAQTLGSPSPPEKTQPEAPKSEAFGDIDINTIKKISAIAGGASIDQNQRALLLALRPYIGQHRLSRLERAMQAARMANLLPGIMGR